MTVQSAQSITVLFTTRVAATQVGTNADSLPAGTLYVNGTANGAAVTVTNISTGLYKAAVTLPTLAAGDEVEIVIAATVSSVADTAVIWGDTNDFIGSAGALTTVASVTAGVTVTTNNDKTGYALTAGEHTALAGDILDSANGIETGYTFRQVMRLIGAVLLGKNTATATSDTFRNITDTKARVTATDDTSGNRTVITLDAS